jgi:hypothetical protein
MTVIRSAPGEAVYGCTLPAFGEREGGCVEYYFTCMFDGLHNERPLESVKIVAEDYAGTEDGQQ